MSANNYQPIIDLIHAHDERNGGTENFIVLDTTRVSCRYADLSIWRRDDGWHYGANITGYPTPKEAYERRNEK